MVGFVSYRGFPTMLEFPSKSCWSVYCKGWYWRI